MLKGMEGAARDGGVGEGEAWIGLALTHFMLLSALEVFKEDDGRIHAMYCLRGDVAFFAGEWQMEPGNSPEVNAIEAKFAASNSDLGRRES